MSVARNRVSSERRASTRPPTSTALAAMDTQVQHNLTFQHIVAVASFNTFFVLSSGRFCEAAFVQTPEVALSLGALMLVVLCAVVVLCKFFFFFPIQSRSTLRHR